MTPSKALPQVAIIRLQKNTNKNFILDNLPESAEKPYPELACINCPNAQWRASELGAKCFCRVRHEETYNYIESLEKILICSDNLPPEDTVTEQEQAPEEEQPNVLDMLDAEISDLTK